MISRKFKPQYNETILSLQYCKLTTEEKENTEEWMGHMRVKHMNVSIKRQEAKRAIHKQNQ